MLSKRGNVVVRGGIAGGLFCRTAIKRNMLQHADYVRRDRRDDVEDGFTVGFSPGLGL
jgi:hypothetical protein